MNSCLPEADAKLFASVILSAAKNLAAQDKLREASALRRELPVSMMPSRFGNSGRD
jgi:hypothetical protein